PGTAHRPTFAIASEHVEERFQSSPTRCIVDAIRFAGTRCRCDPSERVPRGAAEAKSLGDDGGMCRRDTRGILTRRPVEAIGVIHIGRESNRLDERLAGLITSEEDFLLSFGRESDWRLLVIPAARLLG